jgi:hypothetical protein
MQKFYHGRRGIIRKSRAWKESRSRGAHDRLTVISEPAASRTGKVPAHAFKIMIDFERSTKCGDKVGDFILLQ